MTVRRLCEMAGVSCRATGSWTDRIIVITPSDKVGVTREPGDWGTVWISVPQGLTQLEESRYALAYLAYGVFDPVARESVRGTAWSRASSYE